MTERETIEAQIRSDITRVMGLVALFQKLSEKGHIIQPEQSFDMVHIMATEFHQPFDLLRAAVVLLHASLENFFRSILEWKLPEASPESLAKIPLLVLKGGKAKDVFSLVDLAEFRGQSVDSVIAHSVGRYLERSNYSHVRDLLEAMKKSGIDYVIPIDRKDKLAAMMSRRHWIAHRADRDPAEEIDPAKAQVGQSISPELVSQWINAVVEVGNAVLKKS